MFGKKKAKAKEKDRTIIGENEILKARSILEKYKESKSDLEKRIVENDKWFKLRHWEVMKQKPSGEHIPPTSAWLFNSLLNKHADAMDNYPEPNVLPREESDKDTAQVLSEVLPVVFEQNDYEQTYSDTWWYKLKVGTSVTGVFWNSNANNGLGDIEIKKVDLLNLFWEPGITNIQESKNVFYVMLVDNDVLESQYEALKGTLGGNTLEIAKYAYDDTIDTTNKSAVIDWYYKKDNKLHFVKFVNSTVLYATENDENYKDKGLYDHGEYPFVFDVMFQNEGSPTGFGFIDVMKSPQAYIDELNDVILKNAKLACKPRFLIKNGTTINREQFADWDNDFIDVSGNNLGEESIRQLSINTLPSIYVSLLNNKVEELKETSGNRDFSQGSTSSGVTSGTAIASLMEAGSKLSRDQIKASYRAFVKICNLVIENIRQFYDEPRCFRIIGEHGDEEFRLVDNSNIKPQEQENEFGVDMGDKLPIFDIKVTAQKSNPFNKLSQNELMIQLYQLGAFNPQMADQALVLIDGMDFENKNAIKTKIGKNATMFQQMQQMQQQLAQVSAMLDAQTGGNMGEQTVQEAQIGEQKNPSGEINDGELTKLQTNSLASRNPKAQTAQESAKNKVQNTTRADR